jgi:S1-C subfamily serine protease
MTARRVVIATSLVATAASFFTLGVLHARRADSASNASYDAKLDAIRAEVGSARRVDPVVAAGTTGRAPSRPKDESGDVGTMAGRAKMVAQIKQELQNEMGLLPVQLLRERRSSFVELYSSDSLGKTNYGTAGYLGHGYFVTVKHAVIALRDDDDRSATTRKIVSIKIMYKGKEIPAKLVDTGDADVEVHSGDWAIIKTRDLDLPALSVDTAFSFEFADPIFRLGNDYSKGIILSTGYVGQHTSNGLVTCLTDGHPGVSGGGVLDQRGNLVGIPIGRMQGDYRFSFILPIRAEMMRKVPSFEASEPRPLPARPLVTDLQ